MSDKTEEEMIKDAVNAEGLEKPAEEIFIPSSSASRYLQNPRGRIVAPQGYEGMQPSIMVNEVDESAVSQQVNQPSPPQNAYIPPADYTYEQQQAYPQPQAVQDPYSSQYPQQDYNSQQYQPYQETMSSDVITEISEQVIDEKLSILKDKMENAINYKTLAEAKITSIDKRLRRIEQIIDTLQISLLQRVSEYVTDIKDIKVELQETQKSFKAIAPHSHASHSAPAHHSEHREHPHHAPSHIHSTHQTTHHAAHPTHHSTHHTSHAKKKKHHP